MKHSLEYIAEAIKDGRKEKGLSQRALSKRVGVPQGHISKIENGVVDLQTSSLIEISRALDLEVMLISRKLVPAVRSLQPKSQETSFSLKRSRTLHDVQRLARNLARNFPDHDEFEKLLEVTKEIEVLKTSRNRTSKLEKIFNQLLDLIRFITSHHSSGKKPKEEFNNLFKEIRQLVHQLENLRNLTVHGANKLVSRARPAYRLTIGEVGTDG